ncbi:MAG: ribosomal L7Ae/L30e/S12e/Gadd45 family protein [Clostridiaceae bacterium]|nr:ribosomal L7Ae/L30e/S12e/Gadd45 family protein [Clostridiaceae bacterium]
MKTDNVLRMIGLAKKAGRVVSGEYMTENAVKSGAAKLVIIAEDVSENTRKKFRNMCNFYEVPIREYSSKDELGRSMGKEFRASLAVTDEGLAQAILKKMD